MILVIYRILSALVFFALAAAHPFRLLGRKYRLKYGKNLGERFGAYPESALAELRDRRPIWIHAVSVGETIAASPVATMLGERFPERPLVFSTTTRTGRMVAQAKISEADLIIHFPFDLSWSVRKALDGIQPSAVILMESEFWPEFLYACMDRDIPVLCLNCRISDRTFPRYMRFPKIFRWLSTPVTLLAAQSRIDLDRLNRLGAGKKARFMGNVKFDQAVRLAESIKPGQVRAELRIRGERRIFLAGSTHPGEEKIVLAAYRRMSAKIPKLLLVLVPRHIERAPEIAARIKSLNLACILRSNMESGVPANVNVLLVDTMGELANLYSICDFAFVGGSLVPVGGHNPLEPAAFGKPIITGPHTFNFSEIMDLFRAENAVIELSGEGDPSEEMSRAALSDNIERFGERALNVVRKNAGALSRIEKILRPFLE